MNRAATDFLIDVYYAQEKHTKKPFVLSGILGVLFAILVENLRKWNAKKKNVCTASFERTITN